MITFLFWFFLILICYAYAGYTLLLFIINLVLKLFQHGRAADEDIPLPAITIFITAYNEEDYVDRKMQNTLELIYPREKLHILWITDGSTDDTPGKVKKYKQAEHYHLSERRGKVHAMNRGMNYVKTPLVVFSDTNTLLGKNALLVIARLFDNKNVGCVAGEKRIIIQDKDKAVSSGEGIYWKYESLIKQLESNISSSLGAAGELFAIRRELFTPVPEDTILDDFTISLEIAKKGYKIKYSPEAWASENASLNIKEEMKRKVRIASGGIQTMLRMKELLNPFRYGLLSFQYLSHKMLRWTLVPVSFILIFVLNLVLLIQGKDNQYLYFILFIIQLLYYLLVLTGRLLRTRNLKAKIIFLPYYLFIMNYSELSGMIMYFSGKHTALWEKAKRQ